MNLQEWLLAQGISPGAWMGMESEKKQFYQQAFESYRATQSRLDVERNLDKQRNLDGDPNDWIGDKFAAGGRRKKTRFELNQEQNSLADQNAMADANRQGMSSKLLKSLLGFQGGFRY